MKLSLQIVLGALSLIMFTSGVFGLFGPAGSHAPCDVIDAAFDNQARYVSGTHLVFPLLIWWIIPNIERHTIPFRIICAALLMGGFGRLISVLQVGAPRDVQLIAMAAELTPALLMFWHAQVVRQVKLAEAKTPAP